MLDTTQKWLVVMATRSLKKKKKKKKAYIKDFTLVKEIPRQWVSTRGLFSRLYSCVYEKE